MQTLSRRLSGEQGRLSSLHPTVMPIAVGVAATGMSLIRSDAVSLWTDEAITVSAATRSWSELFAMLANVDAVHGVYYAFMSAWVSAFGISEFALRLPSALFVGVAVAFTALLGRRIRGESLGLAAAIVLMLLPRMTWAGIEARPWALTAAIAAVAMWALLRGIDTRTTPPFVAYGALVTLGILVNIYLALALAAHAVTVLLIARTRPVIVRFACAAIVAVLVASPLVLVVRGQQAQLGVSGDRSPVSIARKIVINVLFLGETPSAAAAPDWLSVAWSTGAIAAAVLGWLVMLWAVAGRRSADDRGPRRTLLAITLPWLFLPLGLVAAYAVLIGPIFQPRYFTFCAPAAALLIAFGLLTLPRVAAIAIGAILAVAVTPVYVSQRIDFAKAGTDWSAVSRVMATTAKPGDAVYFTPRFLPEGDTADWTARRIAYGYPDAFADLNDLTLVATGAATGSLDGESRLLADSDLARHDTIWVLYGKNYPSDLIEMDAATLRAEGFSGEEFWEGPRTVIVRYSREL